MAKVCRSEWGEMSWMSAHCLMYLSIIRPTETKGAAMAAAKALTADGLFIGQQRSKESLDLIIDMAEEADASWKNKEAGSKAF